jgi:hypothetical protein
VLDVPAASISGWHHLVSDVDKCSGAEDEWCCVVDTLQGLRQLTSSPSFNDERIQLVACPEACKKLDALTIRAWQ